MGGPIRSRILLEDEYLRETGFFQDAEHSSEGATKTVAIPCSTRARPRPFVVWRPGLASTPPRVLAEIGLDAAGLAA